jgi:hypothetical protein
VLFEDVCFKDVLCKDMLFEDVWFEDVLFMMLMMMRCLRCCWLSFDVVVLWCWYEMNYLYAAYTAESYLRCKCRSKSKSCKMFMKFLRRKMLSPCILIYRWGLMPWSFCSTTTMELLLKHDDGAFAQPWRWSFCSNTTMELLLNHDDGAFAQPRRWGLMP